MNFHSCSFLSFNENCGFLGERRDAVVVEVEGKKDSAKEKKKIERHALLALQFFRSTLGPYKNQLVVSDEF